LIATLVDPTVDNRIADRVGRKSGKRAGYLNYSIYNGVPKIGMIFVENDYRRRGIAMKLLKALQELSPNEEIDWGYTTNAGSGLKRSINFRKIANPDIIAKYTRLANIKSKLQQMNYKLERLQQTDIELARRFAQTVGDRWNELSDKARKLEDELKYSKGEYTKIIPEAVNGLYEKWSQKYKRSINCARPRGFSQKAHCAGRKK
jgi:GNAT superfamily N-acetyltransferase